jgi:hypothetical protein
MSFLSRKSLTKYFAEMVVVVLGILIAFQFEEWRQDFREQREIDAALARLKDEIRANLRFCETVSAYSLRQVRAVQTVLNSLQSGHLRESDRAQFEAGLVKIGWIAMPPYFSTVAEEMISTGLLKELDQAELRSVIARIPGSVASTNGRFTRQLEILDVARAELRKSVEFRFNGSIDDSLAAKVESGSSTAFVDSIGVTYDFDTLANTIYLKNMAIDAASNQVENFAANQRLCQLFEDVDSQLNDRG